jgi:hypothetical protein
MKRQNILKCLFLINNGEFSLSPKFVFFLNFPRPVDPLKIEKSIDEVI